MNFGIGERIKAKRLELGLTQLELAKKMGYTSRAAICKVERGQDNITSDRVTKFANALGCSESYIMGWEDETGNKTPERQLLDIYARNIAKKQTDEADQMILDLLHNVSPEAKDSFVQLLKSLQPQSELPRLHSKKD